MRKTFLFIFVAFAAVCGLFAQNAASAGVIRELTGNVELKPAGASAFVAARSGDQVAQNTIVSTGFKSTAIIEVGSSVIAVRPLTRLSLAEIQSSGGAESLNVDLQTGRVRVDVNPPAGTRANFTVQSPTATASVRGTSFEFDTVKITVNEGKVAFSGASGLSAMVNAGRVNFIGTDREPADISSIMEASLVPSTPVGMPPGITLTQVSPTSSGNMDFYVGFQTLADSNL
ncbi:MAG: FecR family protein [Treponema sp.]|nr:FecR family protein [Treponema sp.]